jgi:copper chaperone CopZ
MRRIVLCLVVSACGNGRKPAAEPPVPPSQRPVASSGELLAVSAFDSIGDRAERSRALFVEAARVLTHPRCINCHPNGDTPHQGMQLALHDPPVVRGPEDNGVPNMECTTCHQDRNQALTRVPGAPKWHLAPLEMAWVGKSVAYVCNQLKDPKRNGGKTLEQIVEHSGHDELVAWGWDPGAGREKAPGTQQQFGELMAAWAQTGAECPSELIAPSNAKPGDNR